MFARWLIAWAAIPAVVFAACSSDDGGAAPPATGGTGGAPDGGEAGGGADAEAGSGAGGGAPACATDADCPAGAPRCDVGTGACVECLLTGDPACPAATYCDVAKKLCAPGCDDDLDCTAPTVCDAVAHACVGCVDDGDCAPGTVCKTKACVAGCTPEHACPGGESCCDGACVDLAVNVEHCGSCGGACAEVAHAEIACQGSACVLVACDAGRGDCNLDYADGCEVDLLTSIEHCGACQAGCASPQGTPACSLGVCAVGACDTGWGDCNQVAADGCEVHTDSDATSCGSCGKVCPAQGGTPECKSGVCGVSSCAEGVGDCDGNEANGCEASLKTLSNCGGCGQSCALDHASESCATGACAVVSCDPSWGDCDGAQANGCEASLKTLADCGGCGQACVLANASESCATGACKLAACDAGWGNCNGIEADGCEASLKTLADCGACGQGCNLANADESCATGTCELGACHPGYDDCDGAAANGCETALTTKTNCGACGVVCELDHAAESCGGGTCLLGACDAGWGNCDGVTETGCETPLTTLASCGACGQSCALAHATATCAGGTCAVAQCDTGWGDCNGVAADGCEMPLTTPSHCGACNTPCQLDHASESCASGACLIEACEFGWANCDGYDATGCETDIDTGTMHCGGCNNACPGGANAVPTCTGGSCGVACASGYGDCDLAPGNGCETQLNTLAHCGACNTPCDLPNASESCLTGSCALGTCAAGFGNCDGDPKTGCETSLASSQNCGSCGNVCPAGWVCYGGSCVSCSPATWTFDTTNEGFVVENAQTYSEVKWDAPNLRISVFSDRRDPGDEIFKKDLTVPFSSQTSFSISSRWRATIQGNWQGAYPLYLGPASGLDLGATNGSIYFYYSSRDSNIGQQPQYILRYRDASGVFRINLTYTAFANTEYRFLASYDANTKVLTLKMRSASDVDLATASYTLGTNPNDGFTVEKVAVGSDGTSGTNEPKVTAWADTIQVSCTP